MNIKPCPFCGKVPKTYDDDGVTMVYCNNDYCHLSGEAEMSLEAWNTRPTEAELLEAGELLHQALVSSDNVDHLYKEIYLLRLAIAKAKGSDK